MNTQTRYRDLTGYRSGRLVVQRFAGLGGTGKRSLRKWECLCDCGKITIVHGGALTKTDRPTRSCGCLQREIASDLPHNSKSKPRKDLIGMRFGKLTVVEFAGVCPRSLNLSTRRLMWKCLCDCGNTTLVRGSSLGRCTKPTKSCGCLLSKYRASSKQIFRKPRPARSRDTGVKTVKPRPAITEHTKPTTPRELDPELTNWLRAEYEGMQRRCSDDDHPYYHLFGGQGIQVKWDDFETFEVWVLNHLGVAPVGTKLIRIDKYKHFEGNNLRWATRAT